MLTVVPMHEMTPKDDSQESQPPANASNSPADSQGAPARVPDAGANVSNTVRGMTVRHGTSSGQISATHAPYPLSKAVGTVQPRSAAQLANTQAALARSEARFRAVFDRATVGIALIDPRGMLLETNTAFQHFLGYTFSELRGRLVADFAPSEDKDAIMPHVAQLISGGSTSVTIEQRYVRKDGQVVWASVTLSRADAPGSGLTLGNGSGTSPDDAPVGIVVMTQDITARKSLEDKLTYQAQHDPLTNLANRSFFREKVNETLARHRERQAAEGKATGYADPRIRRAEHLAVLLLDLDNFKTVNDTLGPAAGDQLLLVAAQRLVHCTRGSDMVARLGGDEFAILLNNVRADAEVRAVAERITAAMRDPITLGTTTVVVGASVGIARPSAPSDTVDELLRNADVAMYTAKANGKGRHQFFERTMYTAMADRAGLEAELRRAVTQQDFSREFELVYQPLIQLGSGRVAGVEALLRWRHPRRGALKPLDFIPTAESTGLIVPLGRAVLWTACHQMVTWTSESTLDQSVSVSVNVSGLQLHDVTLLEDIHSALHASGLAPHRLILEITESVLMQRTEETLHRLRALKALGVRLAIDDFGTGYSSLSYLQQFPIDILKIDKAFVDGIGHDGAGDTLTRTIIGLGSTLGVRTVAEGIEFERQQALLQELGCELGQGFLFAEPLSVHEMGSALEKKGLTS